jgi:hypothetical protein
MRLDVIDTLTQMEGFIDICHENSVYLLLEN